jgi:hypothetical protein
MTTAMSEPLQLCRPRDRSLCRPFGLKSLCGEGDKVNNQVNAREKKNGL